MKPEKAADLLNDELLKIMSMRLAGGRQAGFSDWRQRTELLLRRLFPHDPKFSGDFSSIIYSPSWSPATAESVRAMWVAGCERAEAVIGAAIFDIEVLADPVDLVSSATIDPELWAHVEVSVRGEQWAQVASGAATFVESTLHRWAGLPTSTHGVHVMTAVLKRDAGRFPLGRTDPEREGWHQLGRGLLAATGNVDRHRVQDRPDLRTYAVGVLGAASLLLTQMRYQHGNSFQT